MKAIFLAALIAISGISCGPISVSDNNIGDIINVGVNVETEIKSEINADIVNILVALLANIDLGPRPPYPPTGLPPTGPPTYPPTGPPTYPPTGPPTYPPTGPPTFPPTDFPTTGLPPTGQPPTDLPSTTTISPPPSTTVEPSPFSSIHVNDLINTIESIKQQASGANLTKEQKEQIWRDHTEQFVRKLMNNRQ
ncbi:hypothetical protein RP20_CCG024399 [Aedes albopictus]|nr:hypothetical protein RP20_CCG024399 [Aedes albopictus]